MKSEKLGGLLWFDYLSKKLIILKSLTPERYSQTKGHKMPFTKIKTDVTDDSELVEMV